MKNQSTPGSRLVSFLIIGSFLSFSVWAWNLWWRDDLFYASLIAGRDVFPQLPAIPAPIPLLVTLACSALSCGAALDYLWKRRQERNLEES